MHIKQIIKTTIISGMVMAAGAAQAEVEDNAGYQDAYQAWAGAHFILLPTSFLPGPIGFVADLASIPIDIRIKTLPASLIAPSPNAVTPNTEDGCDYLFDLPQISATYENLFGLVDLHPLPTDWKAFSDPQPPWVEHANAQVEVRVDHFYLDTWTDNDKTVMFPSGNHSLKWSANTQIDPLIDITIPIALFIISNEIKYFKKLTSLNSDPATLARAAEVSKIFLLNAGIEAGLFGVGQINSNLPVTSAKHTQIRPFTVYDIKPPMISTSNPNPAPLEANSLGGERWGVYQDQFRATITATDPCDQVPLVGNDAPFLLPLGTTQVTWEAVDTGPLGAGNPGFMTVVQNITVEDTRAPIILVPPSRVIESDVPATTDDFEVGTAVVFDVADPDPMISNTIGNGFNPDTRTEVIWTATDSSGNSDSKSQWITVKTPGTNTAPSVSDTNASGLTSEHIDLELTGSDSDLLSGLFDPLKFKITERPDNGFFVAPLMPYFIEDFRVKPEGLVGDILNNSGNPSGELTDAFCAAPASPIPTDFVYNAEFVLVADDNISYVLDNYWMCQSGAAITHNRISKWDQNGQLLTQTDVTQRFNRITMDADGFLYAVSPEYSGNELFINKFDDQLNLTDNWKLASIPNGIPRNWLMGAAFDSQTGLIFATDRGKIFVFDGADGQSVPAFLGTLKNNENFLSNVTTVAGSNSRGFYIEIDSSGSLYIVDSGYDRIHKFEPSTYDGVTLFDGDHIGWMGRCDSGPGCDVENDRSFGYSCNDAFPCQTNPTSGSAAGQFNTPIGIALDNNDILYITDYDNSRVQRFSPNGDFAGEAASSCDGSCFILGDMGKPLDISVNSKQFFVLDSERQLMHVFETAPFKEITDNSVTVSYASDNDFQGIDSFSYLANDGLVDSNVGTATISIERNFRMPETFDDTFVSNEDETVNITLLADDPDGILGIDFNGLDTLSYEIIQVPEHGTLTGSGEDRSYTPNENFNGTDSLVFRVNDGMFDSNEATVTIDVLAVNDQPMVNFTDENSKILPKQLWPLLEGKIVGDNVLAGLGYPLPLMAEFTDPDLNQNHTVQINWGDGAVENGSTNPPTVDPDNPPEGPLMTNTFNGVGQIFGNHTYLSVGSQTVSLTVTDDLAAASNSAQVQIDVIPMVDITLQDNQVDPDDFPEPGEITAVTIEVSNQAPADPVVGLNATQVVFTGALPEDVTYIDTFSTQGSCTQSGQISTCQLGTIDSNQTVTITAIMQPDELFDPAKSGYIIDASSTEPDASKNNLTVVEIPIKFKADIFANGFEVN